MSNAEAALRLVHFGPNMIHGERKRALILQFLAEFHNPLVIILLIASAISGLTGDAASFFIISAIVIMRVTLDFIQEYRAGQAAERLRQSVAVRGMVLREGKHMEILLAEMVPGDVVFLAEPCRCLPQVCGTANAFLPYPDCHSFGIPTGGGRDEAVVLPPYCRGVKRLGPSP